MQVIEKIEKILDAKLKERNKENSDKKRTAVKHKGVPLHLLLVESHTKTINFSYNLIVRGMA